MKYDVQEPSKGKVTLTLDWSEAEILTRIVGLTNSANLQQVSTDLHDFVTDMVELFGRDLNGEAENWHAAVSNNGQIYVSRAEHW